MDNCIRMRPMCEPRNKEELLNCKGYERGSTDSRICKYCCVVEENGFIENECMNLNMKISEARYGRGR